MNSDTQPWWMYRARVDFDSDYSLGVVDGDTLDLMLDLGLSITASQRVRLAGVDTAEVYGVEKQSPEWQRGKHQTRWVRHWMDEALKDPALPPDNWPLIVHTIKDETGKYGRYLARVVRRCDGECLNEALVERFPEVEVVADGDG